MKTLFTALLALGCVLSAQAVSLTFRVDMHGRRVAAAGVHIAGDFQSEAGFASDWDPSTTALTDANADSIYEITVDVPTGTYLYKFINGTSWTTSEIVPGSCGQADGGGNVNRSISLGSSSLTLPAVPFGGCLSTVRFSVNMQGQTVSSAGVHVMGNFQRLAGYDSDWDPAALALTDVNQDGIYDIEIALPAASIFYYRFVNGASAAQAETLSGSCASPDNNGGNSRVATAMGSINTLPTACFGSCTLCGDTTPATTAWWNDAVFYEVFVRSFYDSNNDGRGDFTGLTAKLDYLNDGNPATNTDLGVTGIWLMPMMPSPSYHGYDITNYKSVNGQYGSMADFDAFLAAAHARGIKVILDMVLNHSSSAHPWFTQSASSTTNSYRDWYVWSATQPTWGQWIRRGSSYFYTYFGGNMPDLNWRSPALRSAMYDATRFWLQKGVDGYRLDAIKFLVEDSAVIESAPGTFPILHELHDSLTAVNPNAYTVGEAWSPTTQVIPYVLQNRLNTCFEFYLSYAILNAVRSGSAAGLEDQLYTVNTSYPKLQYGTFLTNHDQDRVIDVLAGNMPRMRQAAALYLTMPGVPYIYYGEEIGMKGSGVDEDKRKPMQWTDGAQAGFSTTTPWRSINTNYAQFNVATQQVDSASLLNHYKRLIALRNESAVLRRGYYVPATTSSDALLGYGRVYGDEAVFVAANLSGRTLNNPSLSVTMTSLAPGTYYASELYTGADAGTITVDAQGGFSGWSPSLGSLAANQTWILRLSLTPTATAPVASRLKLTLFPNPADDIVRIQLPGSITAGTIEVFDLRGRLMKSAPYTGSLLELDSNPWPTGSYFVRFRQGSTRVTEHLIVTHE